MTHSVRRIGAVFVGLVLLLAGVSAPASAATVSATAIDAQLSAIPVTPIKGAPAPAVARWRAGGKSLPGQTAAKAGVSAALSPTCSNYSYAAGSQTLTGGNTMAGAIANFTVAKPYLNTATACHTLAEMTVRGGATNGDIIEAGWNVDQIVNGDDEPHIFVYHWVNGVKTCYNACGWVDYATNPINAGDSLATVRTATFPANVKKFNIAHDTSTTCGASAGGWWVGYDNTWLGCFPDGLWTAPTFTAGTLLQVFGEVASVGVNDCTDMGQQGRHGNTATLPLDASDPAYIGSVTLTGATGGATANLTTYTLGGSGYSVLGFPTGSPATTRTLTYGGPGSGGVANGC